MKTSHFFSIFATFVVAVFLFSSCSPEAPVVDPNPEMTWANTAQFIELENAGVTTITFKKVKGTSTSYEATKIEFPNNSIMDATESMKDVTIVTAGNALDSEPFLFFEFETDFGTIMSYAGPEDLNKINEKSIILDTLGNVEKTTFYKVRSIPYVFKKDVPSSFWIQGKRFARYNSGYVQKKNVKASPRVAPNGQPVTASTTPTSSIEDADDSGYGWWVYALGAIIFVLLAWLVYKRLTRTTT